MALIIWDALAWIFGIFAFALTRYDLTLTTAQWQMTFVYTTLAVFGQIIAGFLTQHYLGRSRIGSFSEASWTAFIVAVIAAPLLLLFTAVDTEIPRGVTLAAPPMALLIMGGARWLFRSLVDARSKRDYDGAVPALIYGAGNAGLQVVQLMHMSEEPPYRIVGLIDDDRSKKHLRLRGIRVMGRGKDLAKVAQNTEAQVVILAVTSASPRLIQEIDKTCRDNGLELLIVPPVREMVGGQVTIGSIRQLNVADLLGRRPISTDLHSIAGYITGKRVLVTGAGGSIGAELANQVYMLGPKQLLLLDRDESALHGVQLDIYGHGLLNSEETILCDIRDEEALREVFHKHQPEVVFHAAALKHLPMLERFPVEGWKTNVLGTRNVLRMAQETGVERFVNISTDKAAAATSVLGRTKRLAERLTAWYAEFYGLPYLSVRFGNVLGSRGSVLITFRSQIEKGGPVTVTHPDVTRYFMTIPEACELVLQAGAIGEPGDVLVLDMGEPVRILDVAERMIAESGKDIEVQFTGLRDGEKMHEVLFSTAEIGSDSRHPLISAVHVPSLSPEMVPDDVLSSDDVLEILDSEQSIRPEVRT
ncbi:dTDP-glucose 4,6-dehydratase [Tessaracoccus flavus]|uniref:dTDP-glucose 4,6-dehydratase n=2 Tax=Tessaracoccus flavus TaxID=1610493 RepID=A0A1Q2CI37_9ACTN|nr:dTDP-glucose 4,6-dehydratase [Tessaracoccus flavus]